MSGALLSSATSQNPRSLRCDRSIMIFRALQARINSLPISVRPGPMSGEDAASERHAVREDVRRLHRRSSAIPPDAASSVSSFGSTSAPSICRSRHRAGLQAVPDVLDVAADADAAFGLALDPHEDRRHAEHAVWASPTERRCRARATPVSRPGPRCLAHRRCCCRCFAVYVGEEKIAKKPPANPPSPSAGSIALRLLPRKARTGSAPAAKAAAGRRCGRRRSASRDGIFTGRPGVAGTTSGASDSGRV